MLSDYIQLKYVIGALLYSCIGLGIFIISFAIFEWLTPKINIWQELIERQNIAFAIFMGAIALGIAIIVSSAIHG